MKKILTTFLLIFLSFYSFSQDYKVIPGEKVDFLVSFGIFNAGEASMITDTNLHSIDNEETIKIDVTGKSIGVFDLFTTVRDKWGVYITEEELEPKKFYKYLLEGKYRKNEILNFVENSDSVQIEILDKETKEFVEFKYLHFEDDIKTLLEIFLQLFKKNKDKTFIDLSIFAVEHFIISKIRENNSDIASLDKLKVNLLKDIKDFSNHSLNLKLVLNSISNRIA